MHRLKTVSSLLFNALGGAAVVLVGGLLALNLIVPRLTKTVPLTVLTGSMTPTIPQGSLVLVRPTDPDKLEIGDVITFESAPRTQRFVTHRIVDIDATDKGRVFTTRGDANPSNDPDPVPAAAVRGTVRYHVAKVGLVADRLRSPSGMAALVLVPLGLLAMTTAIERLKRRGPDVVTVPAVPAGDGTREWLDDIEVLLAAWGPVSPGRPSPVTVDARATSSTAELVVVDAWWTP